MLVMLARWPCRLCCHIDNINLVSLVDHFYFVDPADHVTLKGRFWERSKLVLEYSRISPDFAALIFFSEKFIFLVRQQVRHPLIHSGSPCHVSQPTLLPSLCRWAAQHSASPSPYCTVCTPLCQPFSSLPAVTHTSHNSDARLSCYTTRISGFYS